MPTNIFESAIEACIERNHSGGVNGVFPEGMMGDSKMDYDSKQSQEDWRAKASEN